MSLRTYGLDPTEKVVQIMVEHARLAVPDPFEQQLEQIFPSVSPTQLFIPPGLFAMEQSARLGRSPGQRGLSTASVHSGSLLRPPSAGGVQHATSSLAKTVSTVPPPFVTQASGDASMGTGAAAQSQHHPAEECRRYALQLALRLDTARPEVQQLIKSIHHAANSLLQHSPQACNHAHKVIAESQVQGRLVMAVCARSCTCLLILPLSH